MQKFWDIPSGETLVNSRQKLLDNDSTVMSCHAGTAPPTTNLVVGMLFLNTTTMQLFQLKALTPDWKLIADLNKTTTNKEYVDNQDATKVDKVSANRPGVTKLYRKDSDSAYNVQVEWDNTYWWFKGYNGDTYHAGVRVAKADSVEWTGVANKPLTFNPPIATESVLGGVKQGSGCTIAIDGTLSINFPPVATGKALFSSPGSYTWTVPDGVTRVYVTMSGGGGGGGGAAAKMGGGGGGAAMYCSCIPVDVTQNDKITVTVGDGGTGGQGAAWQAEDGSAGGVSSFGSVLSVIGGGGGQGGKDAKMIPGAVSYVGSGGSNGYKLLNGGNSFNNAPGLNSAPHGDKIELQFFFIYGGGGGCGNEWIIGQGSAGRGADAKKANGGGNNGENATLFGAGGGGGGGVNFEYTGGNGGNGKNGFVFIEW